jgi:hypothetical protein
LSLSSADGKYVIFSISNLCINQADAIVRKFPTREQFPAELKVDRITKEKSEGFFNSIGLGAKWARVIYGHGALANPELRGDLIGRFVDWDKAAEAEKTIGPAFRKLVEFEEKPTTTNAGDGSKAN